MNQSASNQNGYRLVPLEERQQLRNHLKRLTESDRRTRFDPGIEAEDFRQHFSRARPVHEVIGWFENGILRGAVEIYYRDELAEAGLTLEEVYRGKGIGTELVRHAVRQASAHGVKSFTMPFIRGSKSMTEVVAMLSSQQSFGLLCRFLGRRVASVEMGAALPASETRQGTRSRGRFAEGSGLEGSGFRLRYGELAPPGRAAGSAARPKRAGLTRLRAGCDR